MAFGSGPGGVQCDSGRIRGKVQATVFHVNGPLHFLFPYQPSRFYNKTRNPEALENMHPFYWLLRYVGWFLFVCFASADEIELKLLGNTFRDNICDAAHGSSTLGLFIKS